MSLVDKTLNAAMVDSLAKIAAGGTLEIQHGVNGPNLVARNPAGVELFRHALNMMASGEMIQLPGCDAEAFVRINVKVLNT